MSNPHFCHGKREWDDPHFGKTSYEYMVSNESAHSWSAIFSFKSSFGFGSHKRFFKTRKDAVGFVSKRMRTFENRMMVMGGSGQNEGIDTL